jgi:hypothetical protein
MTGIRRSLLLLALTVAVVSGGLGPAHPAQASFSEKVTAATTQIVAGTVAPPTAVTGSLTCGRSSATLAVNWTASTAAKISGYTVSVIYSDGYVQTVDVAATATTWSKAAPVINYQTYSIRYTVTTLTTYGWTAESASTGWFQC